VSLMKRRTQQGMTLIEAMLVIAVGAFIIYLSIQQYQQYKHDGDIIQVKANVDTIFQAMTGYYRTNCYGQTGSGQTLISGSGSLSPSASPTNPFPINIATLLQKTGYLTTQMPFSPIVDATGPGLNGYVAQYNQAPSGTRYVCMAGNNTTGPFDPNCTSKTPVGTIVVWKAQVAVLLKDTSQANVYLKLLDGDCLSSYSGGVVTPCSSSGNTGNYVVWERLPSSNSNPSAISDYWETIPLVHQFTQMYTTNPILSLTNGSATGSQYYLCPN